MNSNFRFLDLCLILTVCTILAILTTGYSTQQAAARAKCMENLKTMGTALAQYAKDNTDMLPVVNDRDNWKKIWCLDNRYVTYLGLNQTTGIRKKGNVLECPAEENYETFTHIGYVMNVNLHTTDSKTARNRRGGKLSGFSCPSLTIAATDGKMHLLDNWKAMDNKENVTRARHEGELNVLMLDGAVVSAPKLLSNLDGCNPKSSWLADDDK